MRKKLTIFAILLFATFLLFGCKEKENTTKDTGLIEQDTTVIENERLIYLGDEKIEKEILLVFDYSCSYCKQWAEEILPKLDKEYIQTGKAKFRMQSMALLNENSLRLSKFDQNLKEYYPEKYYEVTLSLFKDAPKSHDEDSGYFGSSEYLNNVIKNYKLNETEMLSEPNIDVLAITRKYTKALEVEFVPTIFINGRKVENSFDIEEINELLKK